MQIYEGARAAVREVDRTVNQVKVKEEMHSEFQEDLERQFRKEEREDIACREPEDEFKKRVLRSIDATRHRTTVQKMAAASYLDTVKHQCRNNLKDTVQKVGWLL